jgi:hypothetical protein
MVTIAFSSCKKEKSVDAGGGGGGGPVATLLSKQVSKYGSDSATVNYTYDGQKRLISMKTVGVDGGAVYESEIKLPRNAQGIIQKYVDKSADYVQFFNTDSIFYTVRYDAAAARYTSKIWVLSFGTVAVKDSIAFSYGSNGRITQLESFIDTGTARYVQYGKTEFTYDGNNNVSIAKTSGYDNTASRYVLLSTIQYEYDNKTTALSLGNEAFLIDQPALFSTHNVTKITIDDADPAGLDEATVITYVYNAGNKPVTGNQTFQSGGTAGVVTYTYK